MSLFIDPADTVDGFADQFEKVATGLIDDVARVAYFVVIARRLHVDCLRRQKSQSGIDE